MAAVHSYTPAEAREHIYATFWETFNDPVLGWAGVVADDFGTSLSEPPGLEWDNDEGDNPPPLTKPMMYLYVRHFASRPQHVGGESRRSYLRRGFVLCRVWVPKSTGLKMADGLAYVVKSAFEGKRGKDDGRGIVFRSWRPQETGNTEQTRFQIVCTVDFEYSDVTPNREA